MKVSLFLILFFYSTITIYSQTTIGRQLADQYPIDDYNTKTYGLTWLPDDYNSTNISYPLIIFLHGSGETGDGVTGLNNLLHTGLPKKISDGWNPQAVNPADGKNYKFIVVSPQAPTSSGWSYSYTHVKYILADLLKRYRIDSNRIYITGLSAGGAGTWSCVTNDSSFTKKIAAIAPVSSAAVNIPSVESPNIQYISGKYGVSVWTVCGLLDAFYSIAQTYVGLINTATPKPVVPSVLTGVAGYGHSSELWNMIYDSSWRSNIFNLNLYEWMLQYQRNIGAKQNQPPAVDAGTDKTIKLPMNSVTLSGTATDAGGTIASYAWAKIAGPTQFNIVSANQQSTDISNLVAGTYQFELTVTDNSVAKAKDTVAVTVLPVNQPPVANAGADKFVTLPANGVTLSGSGSDADGTIVSYAWSKTAGPSQYIISNSNTISPIISNLVAGTYTFRLTVTDNNQATGFDDVVITVNPQGNYETIPAKIEAENYTAMQGVQSETTADTGGGSDVGWIDNGDWMDYNTYVPTNGTYTVKFRIATPNNGAALQIRKADGSVLTTLNIPNTNSYQNWVTLSAEIPLTAGDQVLRVISVAAPVWNLNWIQLDSGSIAAKPIPAKIEAETYDAMQGIQMEKTADTDGGLDVGWIDNGDWLDYTVNAAYSGVYTVSLRIATPNIGAKLEIRNSAGTVLSAVTVPITGGYQTWSSLSTSVSLPAGKQTLRIISTTPAIWNLNWINFLSSVLTTKGLTTNLQVTDKADEVFFQVNPNPVGSSFVLQVSDKITGMLKARIINMQGTIIKEFQLNKSIAGMQAFQMPANDLASGKYILEIQLGNRNASKFILKL